MSAMIWIVVWFYITAICLCLNLTHDRLRDISDRLDAIEMTAQRQEQRLQALKEARCL